MEHNLNVMINEEVNALIHDYQLLHHEVFDEFDEDFPNVILGLVRKFLEIDLVDILEQKVKHLRDLMYIEEEIGVSQAEIIHLMALHNEAECALRKYKNYRNELLCNIHEEDMDEEIEYYE